MPQEQNKKPFGAIAILGLIVAVLSTILFLLPTLSNDTSEAYNFSLPAIGAVTIHRTQLMFILVAELFFMAGIYLTVKGLRRNDEGSTVGMKKNDKKVIEDEPKEEPSSLEKVLAEERKAEEAKKAEEAANNPVPVEKKEEKPESLRSTEPIHLGEGNAASPKPADAPAQQSPAEPKQ